MKNEHAPIESQLGNLECTITDTEQMFWLRENDDCQNKENLGDLLCRQYRFKEAIQAYKEAIAIRNDKAILYVKLAGANLTLFNFEEAQKNYSLAKTFGADEKSLFFSLGILCYFRGEYKDATQYFLKSLPCDDELKIAVIYWHTLASYRADTKCELLTHYTPDMKVGHHTAYKNVTAFFANKIEFEKIPPGNTPLDNVIIKYGLGVYLEHNRDFLQSKKLFGEVLDNTSIWPCISYLAAWNDKAKNA